ncbi:MAG TPA: O-antigen ligase family protein [bacterium]|nr:O-antigen ligase family protein [bacterium]
MISFSRNLLSSSSANRRTAITAGIAGLLIGTLAVLYPLGIVVLIGGCVGLWLLYRVLGDPFFGVLLITFFLPFERVGGFDIGGMTIRLHQVWALLTLASWIGQKIIRGELRFRANPLFWPLFLFILGNFASLLNAINLTRGLFVTAFTIFVIITSFMIAELVDTRDKAVRVFRVLFFSAVLVSLFGLFQWIGDEIGLPPSITQIRVGWYNKGVIGMTRLHSTALEPLYFANYLLVVLPPALSLLLHHVIRRVKQDHATVTPVPYAVMLIGSMVIGLAFLLTISRGGYLALAMSCLVLFIFSFKQFFTPRILALGVIGAGALLLVGGVIGISSSKLNLEYMLYRATHFVETTSDWERLEAYEAAYEAFTLSPWFGYGPGNYGAYRVDQYSGSPDEGWGIANNEYLELLAEVGLFGFITLVVALLLWTIRNLAAQGRAQDQIVRTLLIGSLASMAGIALQYMTFSTLYIMHIWWMIGYGVALQRLAFENKDIHDAKE